MKILEATSMSINGIEQKLEKLEMLPLYFHGNIKREGKKSPATVTLAVPDYWAASMMTNALGGVGKTKVSFMLMRIVNEK